MGRICLVLIALLTSAVATAASAPRDAMPAPSAAGDLALLRAHEDEAHLLALWRFGQREAAKHLTGEQAAEIYRAMANDTDWRVRWLAAEALAQARRTFKPVDVKPNTFYTPPRLDGYSLERALADESVYVREAAARELASEQPVAQSIVSPELLRALDDDSETVRELVSAHISHIVTANPSVLEFLLQQRQAAQSKQAEPGLTLICLTEAIERAGPTAMPELISLWYRRVELRGQILAFWARIGPQAADAAEILAVAVKEPDSELGRGALDAVNYIRPIGNLKLADALMPLLLADQAQEDIVEARHIADALIALGPLPETYVGQVLARIKSGTSSHPDVLFDVLAGIGAGSETATAYLSALAENVLVDEDKRGYAMSGLEAMARQGNVAATHSVIKLGRQLGNWQGYVLDNLLPQRMHGMVLHDSPLPGHPEQMKVLEDEIGVAELAVLAPELLAIPDFRARARTAISAEILDPAAKPARIIDLAPLLMRFDPPPVELGARLAEQFEFAGSHDTEYAKALAALNPARARELYAEIGLSQDTRNIELSLALLDGLGAEAEPLLPQLAGLLVGAIPGATPHPNIGLGNREPALPPPAEVANDVPLNIRWHLAQAVRACGPAAAPFARHLLWALKQTEYARARVTIPAAKLNEGPEATQFAIDQAHAPYDSLIEVLKRALAAAGPEAVEPVMAVVDGAFNDGPVAIVTAAWFDNPEYDQRLRADAIAILGKLGVKSDEIASLLSYQLGEIRPVRATMPADEPELSVERKIAAASALGELGVASGQVVMALLGAAKADNPRLQAAAVAALRKLAGWEYPVTRYIAG